MKAKLNCVTIPVADLAMAQRFYEAVFEEKAAEVSEDLVLFNANNGLYLVLSIDKDFDSYSEITGLKVAPKGTSECIMSVFLDSKEAVDLLLKTAGEAGGSVSMPAKTYSWGYAGYLRDPDGHQWEVLHNEKLAEEKKEG